MNLIFFHLILIIYLVLVITRLLVPGILIYGDLSSHLKIIDLGILQGYVCYIWGFTYHVIWPIPGYFRIFASPSSRILKALIQLATTWVSYSHASEEKHIPNQFLPNLNGKK